ncbi:MAG: hypothetical protein KGS09_21800 [Nitrospirae bacterium]|nr:hypothetical protein [Nitrospirota bacterium]
MDEWMDNDLVSRRPLEIGIHKNHFPFTEQGRHRVILSFHGDGVCPRHVRRLDHRFGMDDTRKVLAYRHPSPSFAMNQAVQVHGRDSRRFVMQRSSQRMNGPAHTAPALRIGCPADLMPRA